MYALDKDALLCDLAETYHIYDFKSLTLEKLAIFSIGLKDDSRIKSKMRGLKTTLDIYLNALVVDTIRAFNYNYCVAITNKNADIEPPIYISDSFIDEQTKPTEKKKDESILSFETIEQFEAYRNKYK